MSRRFLKGLSVVVCGLFIFCTFVFITFIFKHYNARNSSQNEKKSQKYNYHRFNPHSGESSSGIVSLPKGLEKSEYISEVDKDGFHSLISHLGTNEYKCTGSCYCDLDGTKSRRTFSVGSTSFISRSLMYLLAAGSLSIAITKAKSHFLDECQRTMDSDSLCQSEVIKVEIDQCTHLPVPDDFTDELDLFSEYSKLYYCTGNCIHNRYDHHYVMFPLSWKLPKRYHSMVDSFPCRELSLEKKVLVDPFDYWPEFDPSKDDQTMGVADKQYGGKYSLIHEEAEEIFKQRYLYPFCIQTTLEKDWEDPKIEKLKESEEYDVEGFPICTAFDFEYKNPTVYCREVVAGFEDLKENFVKKEGDDVDDEED